MSRGSKTPINIKGCADEREMGESLRKIAEMLTLRTEFFREKTEVVGVAEHPFEVQPRHFHVAGSRETFSVPE